MAPWHTARASVLCSCRHSVIIRVYGTPHGPCCWSRCFTPSQVPINAALCSMSMPRAACQRSKPPSCTVVRQLSAPCRTPGTPPGPHQRGLLLRGLRQHPLPLHHHRPVLWWVGVDANLLVVWTGQDYVRVIPVTRIPAAPSPPCRWVGGRGYTKGTVRGPCRTLCSRKLLRCPHRPLRNGTGVGHFVGLRPATCWAVLGSSQADLSVETACVTGAHLPLLPVLTRAPCHRPVAPRPHPQSILRPISNLWGTVDLHVDEHSVGHGILLGPPQASYTHIAPQEPQTTTPRYSSVHISLRRGFTSLPAPGIVYLLNVSLM